jgi:hypothetical protein
MERAEHGPGVWRKLASVLVSPPTGLNHLLVGTPAGSRRPEAVPLSDIRVQFGVTAITEDDSRVALSMDYGYPGSANYRHERPFDYFRIESSISGEGLEHLSTRGLIAGTDYGAGGLYGTYDYYISTLGGFATGQRDLIFVGDAWLALRVAGRHALGVTYQLAGRSSDYLELPDQTQARSTVGVYYTFLGSGGFGAVR